MVALADGVKRERRLAALRAAKATPEHRERARLARERLERERAGDPKWEAYKRASGRRLQAQYRTSPDAQAKRLAAMDGVGEKISDYRLAWCPREYRDAYRALREKDVPAPEARRMIEAEIPGTWMCKNGQEGKLLDGPAQESKKVKPPRTHWDMLLERRSMDELDDLLKERLDVLKKRRRAGSR